MSNNELGSVKLLHKPVLGWMFVGILKKCIMAVNFLTMNMFYLPEFVTYNMTYKLRDLIWCACKKSDVYAGSDIKICRVRKQAERCPDKSSSAWCYVVSMFAPDLTTLVMH